MWNTMDESQKYYAETKKPDTKNVDTVWFHFYEAQKQAKLIPGDGNQKGGHLWGVQTRSGGLREHSGRWLCSVPCLQYWFQDTQTY